jgi:hypothetical protein
LCFAEVIAGATLINYTIAVIVETVAAFFGFAIVSGRFACTIIAYCAIYTHPFCFSQIITWALFIYISVAVVIKVITAFFGFAVVGWFLTDSLSIARSFSTNAVWFIEVIAGTALIGHTIAVVVEVIATDLSTAVVGWFGTLTVCIALEILADTLWFIEVMTGTTLIDRAVAVVVEVITTDLGTAVLNWFGTLTFCIALEIFANTVWFIEVMTGTTLIDCAVAVVVLTIAADLGIAVVCRSGAIAFCIALETFANAVCFIKVVTGATFIDCAVAVIVLTIAADLWNWANCSLTFGLPFTLVRACLSSFFTSSNIAST